MRFLSPVFQAADPEQQGSSCATKKSCIDSVIIPVAGKGSRIWPMGYVTAKNMLGPGVTPNVLYATREAVAAGAKNVVLVGSDDFLQDFKRFFNPTEEDLAEVRGGGKEEQLAAMLEIKKLGERITFAEQKTAPEHDGKSMGLGHAVLQGKVSYSYDGQREHVIDSVFGVILPDDLFLDDNLVPVGLPSLTEGYEGGMVIGRKEVPEEKTSSLGIFDYGDSEVGSDNSMRQVLSLVEKPAPGTAPSRDAIMGRYILKPKVFEVLEQMIHDGVPGAKGEYQLTDAIVGAMEYEPVYAANCLGTHYDFGSIEGLLESQVAICTRELEMRREGPKQGPAEKLVLE